MWPIRSVSYMLYKLYVMLCNAVSCVLLCCVHRNDYNTLHVLILLTAYIIYLCRTSACCQCYICSSTPPSTGPPLRLCTLTMTLSYKRVSIYILLLCIAIACSRAYIYQNILLILLLHYR